MAAPSSKNSMPWRLHVVSDRELLSRLADAVTTHRGRATYVPHDPLTGLPRPEYTSTVVDSGQVLRQVPLAIFIENLGPFSRGLDGLASAKEKWAPVRAVRIWPEDDRHRRRYREHVARCFRPRPECRAPWRC